MVAAAIVYLVRASSPSLKQSLAALQQCFLNRFPHYPILLFHEKLSLSDINELQALVSVDMRPYQLSSFLSLPNYHGLEREQVERWMAGFDGGRLSRLGYIQMCRFFTYELYHHPALAEFEYYWRFDDDSFLLEPLTADPFVQMQEAGWIYGYRSIEYENPREIVGLKELWQATVQFAKQHRLPLRALKKLACNRWGRYTGINYYNNFEINKVAFWRAHPLYASYFQFLDQSLGFYKYRWGDANVRTLAIGLFLQTSQVHHFKEISYRHNHHYAIPGGERIIYCEEGNPFIPIPENTFTF